MRKNPDDNKKYSREYYLKNKERLKPIRKKWRENNKEKSKIYWKKQRETHTDRIKKWNYINGKLQMKFLGKNIFLGFRQQIGYCSKCPNNIYDGTCKSTHMHHYFYCIIMPWACRIELCAKCHGNLTYSEYKCK
jgi:hypothetical protein